MRNEAYNMDCIEYMRSLPDNGCDIAVCDPPYGKGNDDNLVGGAVRTEIRKVLQTFRGGGQKAEAPQWDVAPPQEFFDELFRISRNQIIWGGNYFSLPPTRCFLVWRKTSISEHFSMAMAEYAWTSFTGNAKVFDSPPQRRENSGKFHPTEKPLELYGWIYRNYVKDGETVFDPMMGSQASRIAAYKMGIDYVGCEIDKYYYDKGCEWFERECHGITKTASGKTIVEQTLFEL